MKRRCKTNRIYPVGRRHWVILPITTPSPSPSSVTDCTSNILCPRGGRGGRRHWDIALLTRLSDVLSFFLSFLPSFCLGPTTPTLNGMVLSCYPAAARDAAVRLLPYVHMFYKGNILHDLIRLGVASGYLVLWVVSSGGEPPP